MNIINNGEAHIKLLMDACENVCSFIKTITVDNNSKDDKINNFELKVDNLECLCSSLKIKLEQIYDLVKKLANTLNFTINEEDSSIVILTQLLLSLSNKDVKSVKKRKLYSSYSPLKLSLKEKTEMNEDSTNKIKCMQFEKENKISSQDNYWKLQIKRNGNPSDLLKKSKQTTIMFQPREEKSKMDITTLITQTPKKPVLSSSPDLLKYNDTAIASQNNLTHSTISSTQMEDTNNISLSHFHKIIKPKKNVLPIVKTNISRSIIKSNALHDQTENHEQMCNETLNETFCSPINIPMNVLKNATDIRQNKAPDIKILNNCVSPVLDSFDIIPGLNEKKIDLPDYKFKEDPVRKQNERKLLNGWDCEDCSKFYKANNDNPIEAKTAMNHYSRHRSVKHQHHASTPPGFWDPL